MGKRRGLMEFEDEIGRERSRKGICRPVEGRKASRRAREFRRQNWRERELSGQNWQDDKLNLGGFGK